MAAPNTELAKFLEQEIKKYEGIMVPIKASGRERLFTKKVPIEQLHPNPDDEFCSKTVGPNYSIYNRYVREFQRLGNMGQSVMEEPITVEKVSPDGYMILNGHHRWAAALRVGFKMIPVKIVNLTNEVDIEKMLRASTHEKRVAMDLDEVIFCMEASDPAENPLKPSLSKTYKERIRLGIPALLHFLGQKGYDVWIYTNEYYSLEYMRNYSKHYSVKVDGIVTGLSRKDSRFASEKKKVEKKIMNQYRETLHIDREMLVRIFREERKHEEYEILAAPEEWSRKVIGIVQEMEKSGQKE